MTVSRPFDIYLEVPPGTQLTAQDFRSPGPELAAWLANVGTRRWSAIGECTLDELHRAYVWEVY